MVILNAIGILFSSRFSLKYKKYNTHKDKTICYIKDRPIETIDMNINKVDDKTILRSID